MPPPGWPVKPALHVYMNGLWSSRQPRPNIVLRIGINFGCAMRSRKGCACGMRLRPGQHSTKLVDGSPLGVASTEFAPVPIGVEGVIQRINLCVREELWHFQISHAI